MTTGGLLAGGGLGFAHADATSAGGSGASGGTSRSPGILSGNLVQVPVDVPINVCGVTADVIGLLNPAAGNDCANSGGATATGGGTGAGASGGSSASGSSSDSPGIGSGNTVQVPVDVPVNVCGDSVNVIGLHNAAKGNNCSNGSGGTSGGSSATGSSSGSPGIGSGNTVQVPINAPVNICGDTVNVIGLLDSAKDNACSNGGPIPVTPPPPPPTSPTMPPPPPTSTPPGGTLPPPPSSTTPGGPGGSTSPGTGTGNGGGTGAGSLAHTGSDVLMLTPVGAALVGGGLALIKKFKPKGSH